MYAVPEYTVTDEAVLHGWIRQYPLGVMMLNGADAPKAAVIPFVLSSSADRLIGHIWRHNTVLAEPPFPDRAVVLFQGPQAYVSPGWYPSKADHGKAVPTWNYISVEVRGPLHIDTDIAAMPDYLEPLVSQMEASRDPAWKLSDAPAEYLSRLSRGICGVSIKIENLKGIRKLSQGAPEADFNGVISGLRAEAQPMAHLVADEMMKMDMS